MRTFSSAVQTVINSDSLKYIFLIKLSFSSDYFFTSYHRDITFNSDTYLADGGLYEYDPPKFSSVVDRESYKVIIADLTNAMAAEFRANVIGKPIDVKVALLDSSGYPLLNTSDVLSIYSGFVDKPSLDNSFEEKLAIIEGTSPMSDLDMVRSFMTSKSGMDQKSATDTSFDEVYENKEVSLKWGKV
jgi:hypothetical protein